MTLPNVQLPTYEVKLPSTRQIVTIRPFVVREEKLLLMAAQSDDENEIISTTKQVIRNCILDEKSVNIDSLPFFDIDYLFTILRAKSVGEKIETTFSCNALTEEGNICGHTFYVDIDLTKVIVKNLNVDKTIKMSDKLSIKMRYPTYSSIRQLDQDLNDIETKVQIIASSIDMIVDGDKIYSWKDYTREELIQFIEGLTKEYFAKLERFVENFPSFFLKIDYVCGKCNFEHHLEYDDFTDFFQ